MGSRSFPLKGEKKGSWYVFFRIKGRRKKGKARTDLLERKAKKKFDWVEKKKKFL